MTFATRYAAIEVVWAGRGKEAVEHILLIFAELMLSPF